MAFEPIKLTWKGTDAEVKPKQVMGLIGTIEQHVTMGELRTMLRDDKVRFEQVARAYGAALRYAGVNVANEEVYESLFGGDGAPSVLATLFALMALMIPPSARKAAQEKLQAAKQEKPTAGDPETKADS